MAWRRSLFSGRMRPQSRWVILYGAACWKSIPNLKIITHHCGGLTPYQANRISQHQSVGEREMYREHDSDWHFTKRPMDYFKMMYGDTAVWGNTSILMCGYDFFGVDHVVFGTDMPFGGEPVHTMYGRQYARLRRWQYRKRKRRKYLKITPDDFSICRLKCKEKEDFYLVASSPASWSSWGLIFIRSRKIYKS